MLASINPLGERGRNQRFAITVGAFFVGSTGAGAALGAVLGWIGSPLATRDRALLAIALVALVGLLLDRARRVPGPRRQVDQRWLTAYRGWVYGIGFGAQLGLAFTTIVTASAIYVAFACALLCGSPLGGAIIGAAFGFVRAVPLLSTARVRTPSELRSVILRIERARPTLAAVTSVAQLAAVGCLVAAR